MCPGGINTAPNEYCPLSHTVKVEDSLLGVLSNSCSLTARSSPSATSLGKSKRKSCNVLVVVNLHQVSPSRPVLATGVAYMNGYVPAHGELAHVESNHALKIKFSPECLIKQL
jgi:hypothetical protein